MNWKATASIDSIKPFRLLLDRPIAFHRVFVSLCGSVTSALFLSQSVYWQNRTDGWWWKTQEQWEEETGMSRREQESARNRLKDLGFIKEERRGNPAKLYFLVDFERVQARLAETANLECTKPPNKNGEIRQPYKEAETTTETTNTEIKTLPSVSASEDLSDQVNQIASHHPKLVHRQRGYPHYVIEAIAEAVAHDGFDLVMAGTRNLEDAVAKWDKSELRFIPEAYRFYKDEQYKLDPVIWQRRQSVNGIPTAEQWQKQREDRRRAAHSS